MIEVTTPLPASAGDAPVRVRFCPSPTGVPHVGLVRTALFNWAYARRTGGTLVFRIEDTDAARDSEGSYHQLLEALRWLGLGWDEGVEVGGPNGPYRQSQRGALYVDAVARLRAAGHVYDAYSTPEEVEERHRAAGRDPKLGYDGADANLSDEQVAAYREAGREPVVRLRVPQRDITVDDLVRGPITFPAGTVPDPVLVRANGAPLYTLVNPVDDAAMGITHVLRGEDLLSSTPRQVALHEALVDVGLSTGVPRFGHLPYVMGEGNRKLSKRDPEADLFLHRERGFLPEGLLNYLALLGWSISGDRDVFGPDELCAAFDVADVVASPARFDLAKAEAINGAHLRELSSEDFRDRVVPHLRSAGLVGEHLTDAEVLVLDAAAPLVQPRITLLGEASGMLAFLLDPADEIEVEDAARASLKGDVAGVLDAASAALEGLDGPGEWATEGIETALRTALVEGMGLKPRVAFGPVRVAVTGRRVSPPLFESLEILGRARSLARVAALRASLEG